MARFRCVEKLKLRMDEFEGGPKRSREMKAAKRILNLEQEIVDKKEATTQSASYSSSFLKLLHDLVTTLPHSIRLKNLNKAIRVVKRVVISLASLYVMVSNVA